MNVLRKELAYKDSMIHDIISQLVYLGLILNIIGTILISKSVFYRNDKEIFNRSGGHLGYDKKATTEGIDAKNESLFGCFLLLIGFIGQFIGTSTPLGNPSWITIFVFCLLAIIISLITNKITHLHTLRTVEELIKDYSAKK